jgi:hypothetical protein
LPFAFKFEVLVSSEETVMRDSLFWLKVLVIKHAITSACF